MPFTADRGVVEVFADVTCPFAHVGLRRFVTEREARVPRSPCCGSEPGRWSWSNGEPLDPGVVARHVDELREQVAPEQFQRFEPEHIRDRRCHPSRSSRLRIERVHRRGSE